MAADCLSLIKYKLLLSIIGVKLIIESDFEINCNICLQIIITSDLLCIKPIYKSFMK